MQPMDLTGWIIGLHIFATHLGELPDPGAHRSIATPGVYAVAPSGLTLGFYRNSLSETPLYPGHRWSAYGGWTWQAADSFGPLRDVKATAAAVTGYASPVLPMVGLSARLGDSKHAPRILWVPHRTQPVNVAWEVRF